MYIRTSPVAAQTYQVVVRQSGDLGGKKKGKAGEKAEDRKGCAGDRSDRDGGAEQCSCTERNWRCDNVALMVGRNRLTENVHVVGTWTAYALDRKVVNEQMPNGGGYEEETEGRECVVGTPSWGNPKVWGCVEYVDGVPGREVLG
jgi:hypothetical protein